MISSVLGFIVGNFLLVLAWTNLLLMNRSFYVILTLIWEISFSYILPYKFEIADFR